MAQTSSSRSPGNSSAVVDRAAPQTTPPTALWGLSMAIILGSLTNSIMMGSVNVALPTMMTNLRAEVTQIQWVLTSFMIARTVVMPTLGWAGGWLGNRRLYLISLSVYVAASMLCGLAWDLGSMVVFRIVQGIGAGYLFPLGMAIMHEAYPPGKRGMAMGLLMFGMSFGPAIGPSFGGYLVEHVSWRAVFYINLPIGLIALGAAAATLPAGERHQGKALDLLGLTTMTVFVVSLLVAVSQVRDYGWGSSHILSLLAIAVAGLIAFIAAELTSSAPMVTLQIFANVQFTLGALATFFESFTNFAMNFILALFLQQGLGFGAQHAGELLLPGAIIWGLTSLATGRLADRVEGRWLVFGGSLLVTVVFYGFVHIDSWSSTGIIVGLLMLRSLGRGFIQSPIMAVTMATLPDNQVRLGAGMRGLLNSLGATFGIAMAGFFLQQQIAIRTGALLENQHLASAERLELIGAVHEQLHMAGEDPAFLAVQTETIFYRWLVREATMTAYHDMFLYTAALVMLSATTILWVRPSRAKVT